MTTFDAATYIDELCKPRFPTVCDYERGYNDALAAARPNAPLTARWATACAAVNEKWPGSLHEPLYKAAILAMRDAGMIPSLSSLSATPTAVLAAARLARAAIALAEEGGRG